MESLGTCARVINEQLLQDCSKRAPPLTPPRVTTQSMASTLDLDRARAALMVAAGVTTAAAIVLSQRSILSIMANALKVVFNCTCGCSLRFINGVMPFELPDNPDDS